MGKNGQQVVVYLPPGTGKARFSGKQIRTTKRAYLIPMP